MDKSTQHKFLEELKKLTDKLDKILLCVEELTRTTRNVTGNASFDNEMKNHISQINIGSSGDYNDNGKYESEK